MLMADDDVCIADVIRNLTLRAEGDEICFVPGIFAGARVCLLQT